MTQATASASRRSVVLICTGGAVAIVVFASSSVSIALPAIQRDLQVGGATLQWIVATYALVFASAVLVAGALSDRRGHKDVFIAGLAIFALGSLLCAIGATTFVLLVGRVVQGFGGALVLPVAWSIVRLAIADARHRAIAIGVLSSLAGVASTLGPSVGGLLVGAFGWHSVFWVNIPVSLTLIALATVGLRRLSGTNPDAPIDRIGMVLGTLCLGTLCTVLIEVREYGLTAPLILGLLVAACGLAWAFVRWERRQEFPAVDLSLRRNRAFVVATGAAFTVFFAVITLPIYLALYFAIVGELSPIESGLRLLPVGVAFVACSIPAGYVLPALGPRRMIAIGLATSAVGAVLALRLPSTIPESPVLLAFVLLGAGGGIALPATTHTALHSVVAERLGMASALHAGLRQVGVLLGVAVLGAAFYGGMRSTLEQKLVDRGVSASTSAVFAERAEARASLPGTTTVGTSELEQMVTASFMTGLHTALVVAACALLIAGALSAFLLPVQLRLD